MHSVYAPSRDISHSRGVSHENLRVIAEEALVVVTLTLAYERYVERKKREARKETLKLYAAFVALIESKSFLEMLAYSARCDVSSYVDQNY